jgi:hypothetical protein
MWSPRDNTVRTPTSRSSSPGPPPRRTGAVTTRSSTSTRPTGPVAPLSDHLGRPSFPEHVVCRASQKPYRASTPTAQKESDVGVHLGVPRFLDRRVPPREVERRAHEAPRSKAVANRPVARRSLRILVMIAFDRFATFKNVNQFVQNRLTPRLPESLVISRGRSKCHHGW